MFQRVLWLRREPLSRHSSASLTSSELTKLSGFVLSVQEQYGIEEFLNGRGNFCDQSVLMIFLQRTRHNYSIMFHFTADSVPLASGGVTISMHVCHIDYIETNTTHIIAKVHCTSFEKREQLQIVVTEP